MYRGGLECFYCIVCGLVGRNGVFDGFHVCGDNFRNNFGVRSTHPICMAYYVVLDGRCLVV